MPPRSPRLGGDLEPLSLNELMAQVTSGDEQAFAQVYSELGQSVYGVVLKVLVDPAMAEEVAQEVFVQVWSDAARFDADRGNARSWILTIAHRRAVDRVRSEEARRRRETTDHRTSPDPAADVVAEVITLRSEGEQVRRALDQIPEAQRQAVTLAYFGGNTYRDVAVLLEIPEGTAKTRIRDGLIRLRGILGAQA